MKLVLFELEGCIFDVEDFWMELHKVYGTMREGRILTQRYQKTNNARLVDLVINGLWKKKNAMYLYHLIDQIKYVDLVKENFPKIKEAGFKTAIITDAPSELAQKAKKELEVDFVLNNIIRINNGRLSGEYVWTVSPDNKLEHLSEICLKEGISLSDVIFVGKKNSDIKLANSAGFSIAFRCSDQELKSACSKVIDSGFLDLVEEIKKYL
mgnify:CR=1 FL=1